MRLGVTFLACALAGCTALTDFDRFGFGPELELGDGGSAVDGAADAEPPGAVGDAGSQHEDLEVLEDAGATTHVDAAAPTAPELAPVSGTWLVDRDVRTSDCNAPSFAGYTWTVSEQAGQLTVQTNSPAGSVQSLSGMRHGAVLELVGALVGNAGTNTVTMRLTLSSDGDTFVGDESSTPRCPTTRRVTGTRL